ncbi:MAG: dCMP deaminase family protein [Vampirovibrionales bacterium]|nr:dCMP deaminase family protein [Vampirovibrionales bacterium]
MQGRDKDVYYLQMASHLSQMATCPRRKVGCILLDGFGHIIGTGYNGNARGLAHCSDEEPCDGVHARSGEDLDKCEAIHAEQNALLQCHDVMRIESVYCTTQPCPHCMKMLINTSAKRIIYAEPYAKSAALVRKLAEKRDIELIELPLPAIAIQV